MLLATSCSQSEYMSFATSIDPGGCLVEHIAVDPERQQFYFDGISPDGTKLAVGWNRDGDCDANRTEDRVGSVRPIVSD